MGDKKHGWRGGVEFVAKVDRAIEAMCDPLSPNFARNPVEVRAGMDAVRDRLVEAVAGFERATQERDAIRAENAALRDLLREVAGSGVELDLRKYVVVQIGAETWRQVQSLAAAKPAAQEGKEAP